MSLIVIAFLFRGFEIDNFTYKNINIKKLYLKYDKKLNISTQNFEVFNSSHTGSVNMGITFSVDYVNSVFEFDVQEFHIDNTDVVIKSLAYIDLNLINFTKKSQVHLKDFNIIFDKKLAPVIAKEVTLSYLDNQLHAIIKDPYYKKTSIQGSKVSYSIDKNTLAIVIKTESLLNKTIKEILLHYGVKINTIQHNGQNKITTNISIPFDEDKVLVDADVFIKNSQIEDFGQLYKVNNSTLHFQGNTLKGTVDLKHYEYQDFIITNSVFNYTVDLKKKLDIKIDSKKVNIQRDNFIFSLEDANFHVKNKYIESDGHFINQNNTIFAELTNKINLKTETFTGKINAKYHNLDLPLLITSKDVPYYGGFGDDFLLQISNESANMVQPEILSLNKLHINVLNNIVKTDFSLTDNDNNTQIDFINITDLKENNSMGNLDIIKLQYQDILSVKNKNIAYDISFKDKEEIIINVPLLGLEYKKDLNKNQNILIKKPEKLLNAFSFIQATAKPKGFIKIKSSENFKNTTAYIKNIDLNVDSKYFSKVKENGKIENITLPKFPKMQLHYFNSNITYNDFIFLFDELNLNTNANKLDLKLTYQDATIKMNTIDNSVELHASKLTDTYINTILQKNIFQNGNINIHVYGEDINSLSGDINFSNTTVKNVTVINSLITFINTTPAIINPLLALPTLFRFAQTGFDANGYYIQNGDASFRYNLPTKQLKIYDLYTNGKLSNFIVNSHLDFNAQTIKANVDVSFFKDFTTTLNYIPILGYLIMGDDGEFHTSVDITGTMDDPILETHTVKEATKGVTGILKRIITLPIKPFLPNDETK